MSKSKGFETHPIGTKERILSLERKIAELETIASRYKTEVKILMETYVDPSQSSNPENE